MKRVIVLLGLFCFQSLCYSNHSIGTEIRLEHISGYDYKLICHSYRHLSGIYWQSEIQIDVYPRGNSSTVPTQLPPQSQANRGSCNSGSSTYCLKRTEVKRLPATIPICRNSMIQIEEIIYLDTIFIDSSVYNNPGGYIFTWHAGPRSFNYLNTLVSNSSTGVLLCPPFFDQSNGNQIINSSPKLNPPISNYGLTGVNWSIDYGAVDEDGDSISFEMFTPFESSGISSGSVTTATSPFADPRTMFANIQWEAGYSEDDAIHGFSGPPDPAQDRLQINPSTGELTVTPRDLGLFLFGVLCKEYRDLDGDGSKELMGMVYRDFVAPVGGVGSSSIFNDSPPKIELDTLPSAGTWLGDTLYFSSAPACLPLVVADSDQITFVKMETLHSQYNKNDFAWSPADTFSLIGPGEEQLSLCFSPDSFVDKTTSVRIIANNLGCFRDQSSSIDIYFRFFNYSNAGVGGTRFQAPQNGQLNVFQLLNGDPIPGGTWFNSTWQLQMPNSIINTNSFVNGDSLDVYYVQQEPNYLPDTAFLRIYFLSTVDLSSLELKEWMISPNPFNENLTVEGEGKYDLKLYDYSGRLVYENIHIGKSEINLNLKNGIYLLEIKSQDGILRKRIAKR